MWAYKTQETTYINKQSNRVKPGEDKKEERQRTMKQNAGTYLHIIGVLKECQFKLFKCI